MDKKDFIKQLLATESSTPNKSTNFMPLLKELSITEGNILESKSELISVLEEIWRDVVFYCGLHSRFDHFIDKRALIESIYQLVYEDNPRDACLKTTQELLLLPVFLSDLSNASVLILKGLEFIINTAKEDDGSSMISAMVLIEKMKKISVLQTLVAALSARSFQATSSSNVHDIDENSDFNVQTPVIIDELDSMQRSFDYMQRMFERIAGNNARDTDSSEILEINFNFVAIEELIKFSIQERLWDVVLKILSLFCADFSKICIVNNIETLTFKSTTNFLIRNLPLTCDKYIVDIFENLLTFILQYPETDLRSYLLIPDIFPLEQSQLTASIHTLQVTSQRETLSSREFNSFCENISTESLEVLHYGLVYFYFNQNVLDGMLSISEVFTALFQYCLELERAGQVIAATECLQLLIHKYYNSEHRFISVDHHLKEFFATVVDYYNQIEIFSKLLVLRQALPREDPIYYFYSFLTIPKEERIKISLNYILQQNNDVKNLTALIENEYRELYSAKSRCNDANNLARLLKDLGYVDSTSDINLIASENLDYEQFIWSSVVEYIKAGEFSIFRNLISLLEYALEEISHPSNNSVFTSLTSVAEVFVQLIIGFDDLDLGSKHASNLHNKLISALFASKDKDIQTKYLLKVLEEIEGIFDIFSIIQHHFPAPALSLLFHENFAATLQILLQVNDAKFCAPAKELYTKIKLIVQRNFDSCAVNGNRLQILKYKKQLGKGLIDTLLQTTQLLAMRSEQSNRAILRYFDFNNRTHSEDQVTESSNLLQQWTVLQVLLLKISSCRTEASVEMTVSMKRWIQIMEHMKVIHNNRLFLANMRAPVTKKENNSNELLVALTLSSLLFAVDHSSVCTIEKLLAALLDASISEFSARSSSIAVEFEDDYERAEFVCFVDAMLMVLRGANNSQSLHHSVNLVLDAVLLKLHNLVYSASSSLLLDCAAIYRCYCLVETLLLDQSDTTELLTIILAEKSFLSLLDCLQNLEESVEVIPLTARIALFNQQAGYNEGKNLHIFTKSLFAINRKQVFQMIRNFDNYCKLEIVPNPAAFQSKYDRWNQLIGNVNYRRESVTEDLEFLQETEDSSIIPVLRYLKEIFHVHDYRKSNEVSDGNILYENSKFICENLVAVLEEALFDCAKNNQSLDLVLGILNFLLNKSRLQFLTASEADRECLYLSEFLQSIFLIIRELENTFLHAPSDRQVSSKFSIAGSIKVLRCSWLLLIETTNHNSQIDNCLLYLEQSPHERDDKVFAENELVQAVNSLSNHPEVEELSMLNARLRESLTVQLDAALRGNNEFIYLENLQHSLRICEVLLRKKSNENSLIDLRDLFENILKEKRSELLSEYRKRIGTTFEHEDYFEYNDGHLAKLVAMGHSMNASKRALYHAQNNLSMAINFLIEHDGRDQQLDMPFVWPRKNLLKPADERLASDFHADLDLHLTAEEIAIIDMDCNNQNWSTTQLSDAIEMVDCIITAISAKTTITTTDIRTSNVELTNNESSPMMQEHVQAEQLERSSSVFSGRTRKEPQKRSKKSNIVSSKLPVDDEIAMEDWESDGKNLDVEWKLGDSSAQKYELYTADALESHQQNPVELNESSTALDNYLDSSTEITNIETVDNVSNNDSTNSNQSSSSDSNEADCVNDSIDEHERIGDDTANEIQTDNQQVVERTEDVDEPIVIKSWIEKATKFLQNGLTEKVKIERHSFEFSIAKTLSRIVGELLRIRNTEVVQAIVIKDLILNILSLEHHSSLCQELVAELISSNASYTNYIFSGDYNDAAQLLFVIRCALVEEIVFNSESNGQECQEILQELQTSDPSRMLRVCSYWHKTYATSKDYKTLILLKQLAIDSLESMLQIGEETAGVGVFSTAPGPDEVTVLVRLLTDDLLLLRRLQRLETNTSKDEVQDSSHSTQRISVLDLKLITFSEELIPASTAYHLDSRERAIVEFFRLLRWLSDRCRLVGEEMPKETREEMQTAFKTFSKYLHARSIYSSKEDATQARRHSTAALSNDEFYFMIAIIEIHRHSKDPSNQELWRAVSRELSVCCEQISQVQYLYWVLLLIMRDTLAPFQQNLQQQLIICAEKPHNNLLGSRIISTICTSSDECTRDCTAFNYSEQIELIQMMASKIESKLKQSNSHSKSVRGGITTRSISKARANEESQISVAQQHILDRNDLLAKFLSEQLLPFLELFQSAQSSKLSSLLLIELRKSFGDEKKFEFFLLEVFSGKLCVHEVQSSCYLIERDFLLRLYSLRRPHFDLCQFLSLQPPCENYEEFAMNSDFMLAVCRNCYHLERCQKGDLQTIEIDHFQTLISDYLSMIVTGHADRERFFNMIAQDFIDMSHQLQVYFHTQRVCGSVDCYQSLGIKFMKDLRRLVAFIIRSTSYRNASSIEVCTDRNNQQLAHRFRQILNLFRVQIVLEEILNDYAVDDLILLTLDDSEIVADSDKQYALYIADREPRHLQTTLRALQHISNKCLFESENSSAKASNLLVVWRLLHSFRSREDLRAQAYFREHCEEILRFHCEHQLTNRGLTADSHSLLESIYLEIIGDATTCSVELSLAIDFLATFAVASCNSGELKIALDLLAFDIPATLVQLQKRINVSAAELIDINTVKSKLSAAISTIHSKLHVEEDVLRQDTKMAVTLLVLTNLSRLHENLLANIHMLTEQYQSRGSGFDYRCSDWVIAMVYYLQYLYRCKAFLSSFRMCICASNDLHTLSAKVNRGWNMFICLLEAHWYKREMNSASASSSLVDEMDIDQLQMIMFDHCKLSTDVKDTSFAWLPVPDPLTVASSLLLSRLSMIAGALYWKARRQSPSLYHVALAGRMLKRSLSEVLSSPQQTHGNEAQRSLHQLALNDFAESVGE